MFYYEQKKDKEKTTGTVEHEAARFSQTIKILLNMNVFRQGDTTTVMMELSHALDHNMKLKLGFYRSGGAPLLETVYPDDGQIYKVDDTHYGMNIPYEESMKIIGSITLRATIYTNDLSFVNSGESQINMTWDKEPVNKNLK